MEIVLGLLGFFVLVVAGIVLVGRRRRRQGWSDDPARRGVHGQDPHSVDGRGAVNTNSWMLGGGGGGGA